MITIDSTEMTQRPMRLRHAVRDGQEVGLTFRQSVYAAVVPIEQRYAEQAERDELRQRVAELEQALQLQQPHKEEALDSAQQTDRARL